MWIKRWTDGSLIQSPLQMARSDEPNCEGNFEKCLVSNDKLELVVWQLLDDF